MLDELERLLKDATPGPWEVEVGADGTSRLWNAKAYAIAVMLRYAVSGKGDGSENAALIVAAVNALPALLRVARAAQWLHDAERNARATNAAIDAYDAAQVAQELDGAQAEFAAALAALKVVTND